MINLNKAIVSTLTFLRIIDEQQQLSITNIAMFVVLYKLMVVESTSITDIGGLLIGLSSYNFKKYLSVSTVNKTATVVNQIITKSEELSSS